MSTEMYLFVASFKKSLWSDFMHFFHDLIYIYIAPGQRAYCPQGTKF